jgi:hypothetical protein
MRAGKLTFVSENRRPTVPEKHHLLQELLRNLRRRDRELDHDLMQCGLGVQSCYKPQKSRGYELPRSARGNKTDVEPCAGPRNKLHDQPGGGCCRVPIAVAIHRPVQGAFRRHSNNVAPLRLGRARRSFGARRRNAPLGRAHTCLELK